ncbi:unnamed protein product, partial [Adineta steineri]
GHEKKEDKRRIRVVIEPNIDDEDEEEDEDMVTNMTGTVEMTSARGYSDIMLSLSRQN